VPRKISGVKRQQLNGKWIVPQGILHCRLLEALNKVAKQNNASVGTCRDTNSVKNSVEKIVRNGHTDDRGDGE
jgi:hypothetical protein